MASSKEYLQFILEQLSDLEEINYRAMMGEYIIYYQGRIVGGIYDDRLLVKPAKSAVSYMASLDWRSYLPVSDVKSRENQGVREGMAYYYGIASMKNNIDDINGWKI